MPDWGALVHERMGRLGLTPAQQEEILVELAGHLEDLYEEGRRQGLGESEAAEAVGRALNEATNWRRLRRRIRAAKQEEENMNNRTKSLWLPGLVSLMAAMGLLMVLQLAGLEPHIIWLGSGVAVMLYVPWLFALPLFGAVGAYMSRRAGGEHLTRLAAGLFPSIVQLGLFCMILPVALVVDRQVQRTLTMIGFAIGVGSWVLLPGTALLLGALPFLKAPKLRQS